MTDSAERRIEEVLVAREANDGDGVRLKRVFGGGDNEITVNFKPVCADGA